jgi:hypothetical protein
METLKGILKSVVIVWIGFMVLMFIIEEVREKPSIPTVSSNNTFNSPEYKSYDKQIHDKVIQDAIDQYNIVKRTGSPVDASAYASMVAVCYLQAKDEENYKKWKQIESDEQRLAGY